MFENPELFEVDDIVFEDFDQSNTYDIKTIDLENDIELERRGPSRGEDRPERRGPNRGEDRPQRKGPNRGEDKPERRGHNRGESRPDKKKEGFFMRIIDKIYNWCFGEENKNEKRRFIKKDRSAKKNKKINMKKKDSSNQRKRKNIKKDSKNKK